MEDKEYQKKNLEAIFSAASCAPVFKSNPKHCIGKFADLIHYISYDDVMNYKFIIRGRPISEQNSFDAKEREIAILPCRRPNTRQHRLQANR